MKTDFKTLPSRELNGGIQYLAFYPNGFGASIIKHGFSYGGKNGLWELAVVKGDKDEWDLCYSTRITNDVIGYLTDDDVNKLLNRIKRLKKRD
jgi:hypothetical protein